jgi:hypothetical protein
MPAIIPNIGKVGLMDVVMSVLSGNPTATVHLFQNPLTLGLATVLGDFIESNFVGYVPAELPAQTDEGIVPPGQDSRVYNMVSFSCTGGALLPQPVYGYWVQWLNPVSGLPELLWCELFGSPWSFTAAGQFLTFQLSLGASQG